MLEYQQTIKQVHSFSGKGLHSGVAVNMRLLPAPTNHGVKFCRVDISEKPIIEAIASNVTGTQRGTVLSSGQVSISTVEHLMSALFGLGVDNVLVEVDAPELPILDGSALEYVTIIGKYGFEIQDEPRKYFELKEPIHYKNGDTGSSISIFPDSKFSIDLMIDFNSDVLGTQCASFDSETDYSKEIAPCRTFVFLNDLLPLINSNLIKGGDLNNAIVIARERIEGDQLKKLEEIFGASNKDFIEKGYLNIEKLKYSNECARHKLLDLIGDLALAGVRFKGKIVASKPGHMINSEIAKNIMKMANKSEKDSLIPQFDPNAEPVVDINGIKKLLPHRPPFLMVDRIIQMEKETVVGIKNIGINEGYFIGHFPEEPVMPGVLIIEAMAQVGGILILSDLEEPERYSTYFAKIDNAKFKRKVVPGDVLVIKLHITVPLRRSIVCMKGEVYVGNTLACEADLMAQVIKNK